MTIDSPSHPHHQRSFPNSSQTSQWPIWRLIIPLGLQASLLFLLSAPRIYTDLTGKLVILQTQPVDSGDWLQSHSLEVSLSINQVDNLTKLRGWDELFRLYPGSDPKYDPLLPGTEIFVILQQSANFSANSTPSTWQAIAVSSKYPPNLPANQFVLKGHYYYGTVNYGIDNYRPSITLQQKMQLDPMLLREIRSNSPQPMLLTIKVDPHGNAIPIQIQISDRIYKF